MTGGLNRLVAAAREHGGPEVSEPEAPRICVVGCGGAGNNTIHRISRIGITGAQTIAVNTDRQHLEVIEAETKLLIGKSITRGLGAGGDPSVGEACAEASREVLDDLFEGADLVFVAVGMGGGTGTGSAPVVAEVAKEAGAIVIGVASTPFVVERARLERARVGLEKFRHACDSVIVLENQRLLSFVPTLPIDKAFTVMDQLIAEVVKGIIETITKPSLINLDYNDVRTIMTKGGVAMMLYGESDSPDPRKVIAEALNHPLLDVDYRGATGALIHITGGAEMSLSCATEIAGGITEQLAPDADVILGARVDESFGSSIKVMCIMTGVRSGNLMGPDAGLQHQTVQAIGQPPRRRTVIPWVE